MILLSEFVGAAIAAIGALSFTERLPYLQGHAPPDHTSGINYGRRRQFGAGP